MPYPLAFLKFTADEHPKHFLHFLSIVCISVKNFYMVESCNLSQNLCVTEINLNKAETYIKVTRKVMFIFAVREHFALLSSEKSYEQKIHTLSNKKSASC